MARYDEITIALPDGYPAYARLWNPKSPRGAVLYHHGIQSHCGWYEGSAARLANAGHTVLQVDRRGSGRNKADRGHAESADQLIADAHACGEELLRRSGLDSYHVVGVSWGGKLAVAAFVADPSGVTSLSLVTPGLFPRITVSKSQKAKIGFAMLYEPRRLFDIPLNDGRLFTASEKWRTAFAIDEWTLRQCTASFFLASRRMDKLVSRLPKATPVPTHLFVAGDERIVDNDRTIGFIRDLHWPRCRITTYGTARHAIEFDEPDDYFDDLVAFIDETWNQPVAFCGHE